MARLGEAFLDALGGYHRLRSYTATGWHAQLTQLTSTERGREILGREMSPQRRTLVGWLSETTTPSRANREAIARAYGATGGRFPRDAPTRIIEISGTVGNGSDVRVRGRQGRSPLRVNRDRDDLSRAWSRLADAWDAGTLDADEAEDVLINDIIPADPGLAFASGGLWDFPGSDYSIDVA